MVHCEFVVLPCRVFDEVDRVGVVGDFWGNVDMGDCCGEIVEEFVVELLVSPMGDLQILGMISSLFYLWMMGG